MLNKLSLLLVSTLFFYSGMQAQQSDTLRVMHYNLMNYRNFTSFCTENNNNPDQKDQFLQTIFQYVMPDIFTVNEMGSNWLNPSRLLTNAINKNGIDYYDQAEFASNGSSSLVNMLFYNNRKLALYKQSDITKDKDGFRLVRSIDLYTLYTKDTMALERGDTNFILVAVAHLKAGSTSSDKSSRTQQTTALMDYLDQNNQRISYLFCGDLNIQSSSEESYQVLTNHSNSNIRYYDPVDAAGTWNDRKIYSDLHTQSTHASGGGCFSGGGMDDRFDFVLCGNEVLQNDYGVQYIQGSYKALGQDANRFNSSINSPNNTKVPKNIADALYGMSDHLPVVMQLKVRKTVISTSPVSSLQWSVVNPVSHFLSVESQFAIKNITLIDLQGRPIFEYTSPGQGTYQLQLPLPEVKKGMYLLRIQDKNQQFSIKKMLVQ